jgi:hypothetical protein
LFYPLFLLSNKCLTYLPGCARVSVGGRAPSPGEAGEKVKRLYEEEGSEVGLGRENVGVGV